MHIDTGIVAKEAQRIGTFVAYIIRQVSIDSVILLNGLLDVNPTCCP